MREGFFNFASTMFRKGIVHVLWTRKDNVWTIIFYIQCVFMYGWNAKQSKINLLSEDENTWYRTNLWPSSSGIIITNAIIIILHFVRLLFSVEYLPYNESYCAITFPSDHFICVSIIRNSFRSIDIKIRAHSVRVTKNSENLIIENKCNNGEYSFKVGEEHKIFLF